MKQPLTDSERQLVQECLFAAVRGPFFEDPEFHTLIGCWRDELLRMAEGLSEAPAEKIVHACVVNTILNLIYFPHDVEGDEWRRYISASPEELEDLLEKLRP